MELGQFAILKNLLTEIRDLLKEQQPTSNISAHHPTSTQSNIEDQRR
jgi:hypothetical protein